MKLVGLVVVFATTVAQADSKSDAAVNLVADADSLTASGKHVEACPKLEAALKLAPVEETRVKLSDCYKVVVRSLLPSKQDGAMCERIEAAAKIEPSEGMTLALVTCYKAHASVLLDVPDYARACDRAEKAATALPSAANLANAGGCYVAAKKLGTAWWLFLRAHDTATKANEAKTLTGITELVATVSPARLFVSAPDGATVTLDGVKIPPEILKGARDAFGAAGYPVDAGKHKLEVRTGDKLFVKELEMVDGVPQSITAEFPDAVKPPPQQTPTTPRSSRKKIGWITIAASGALGAVGLYFGYDALTKQNDVDDRCPASTCSDPEAITLNDDAGRSANISNVLVGAALAGGIVGTVLVLTAPKETQLSVSAGPGGGGVTLSRRF